MGAGAMAFRSLILSSFFPGWREKKPECLEVGQTGVWLVETGGGGLVGR